MWQGFYLSENTSHEYHSLFTECQSLIADETDLGFGFRKQLADEIRDIATFCDYRSFSSELEAAFPDVASAVISYLEPRTLVAISKATFERDERVKTDIEAMGRQKAVEVMAAFYTLARFVRSKKFWTAHVQRRVAIQSLDAAYYLFAQLGYEVDKANRTGI